MSKLTKREQYLIVVALLFSIVALVAYVYYFPLQDEIIELDAQAREIDFQIDEAEKNELLIQTTAAEIEQLESELGESDDFLMDSIDEADILSYVSDIILADGQLYSLFYSELVDNDIYFTKDIGLNFTTSYNGLKNILEAFENGEKFTLIPSIDISPEGDVVEETETTNEDGEAIIVETLVSSSMLSVNLSVRFYGSQSSWDGSGDYDFMDENFGKTNIFK